MSRARIEIARTVLELGDSLEWRVVSKHLTTSDAHARALVRLLDGDFGRRWRPAFAVYEPDVVFAAAEAAALELSGTMLEVDFDRRVPGRVY